jgi:hypothetical protein
MCWHYPNGDVYCGFTALQEGGRCSVDYDQYGKKFCIVYSCSGGGGWFPENQGLLPWLLDDGEREQVATIPRVTVRVVEPRT